MKVVAINGSPRPKGNTSILIGHVFNVLKKEGIQTEMIQLGGHHATIPTLIQPPSKRIARWLESIMRALTATAAQRCHL